MKCYKLTDSDGRTKNNTQWGVGVTVSALGAGRHLCSDGFIHFYTHPLIAVFMNPIHANFTDPQLWEAESSGYEKHEKLKSGSKTLTTIRKISLPEVSMAQRVAFAILCSMEVCKNKKWLSWADAWLSGKDRSSDSADAFHCADASHSANAAAASYAYASVYAAIAACHSANAASSITACHSANAAVDVANNLPINFVSLAEKAMAYVD